MNVRVKGVKQVRSASGKIYYYHRATRKRLKAKPGTMAFAAEVDRLDKGMRTLAQSSVGTFGALVTAYLASPEYQQLAERTRDDYRKVLDYLKTMDRMPVAQIDAPFMIGLRDDAFKARKRMFANHLLQVVGTMLNWGRRRKLSVGNPLHGERNVKIPRPKDMPRANRPWSEDEADAIFEAATGGLRVALALAYYAGMRRGDVVRVTWSIYDGEQLEWKQGKTGDPVWLPALSELRAILDAAPRIAPQIATNSYNRPMTNAGLSKAFRLLILRLLKEGKVAPGLTLHGARHTLGDDLANAGAEPQMIQAVLGHRSMSASLHYSRGADRKRLGAAGIHLLGPRRKARE